MPFEPAILQKLAYGTAVLGDIPGLHLIGPHLMPAHQAALEDEEEEG
jgi:hypothetical protein